MTRVRELFTSLTEKDLDLDIKLGDNVNYKAMGLGTVLFRKESKDMLEVKDVLYVSRLTKSLLSVLTMEDKGYVVNFQDGQVRIYPRGSSSNSAKVNGVRKGKLYKLQYQPAQALIHSNDDL